MPFSFIDLKFLPSVIAINSSDIFFSLVNNFESLNTKQIKEIVYLEHRKLHYNKPDYIHRNNLIEINSYGSYVEIIDKSFDILTDMLYWRDNKIYVKDEFYENWQNIITNIPVLPILLHKLSQNSSNISNANEFLDYFLSASTLPSIYNPDIEEMIRSNGLCELHMHINGTSEADYVWNDALLNPMKFFCHLQETFTNQLVVEQYRQIDINFKPLDLYHILERVKVVRHYLSQVLLLNDNQNIEDKQVFIKWARFINHRNIMSELPYKNYIPNYGHPYQHFYTFNSVLGYEGRFLFDAFNHLKKDPCLLFVKLFFYYLHSKAIFHKILVQQTDQYGFDQFQKITNNEVREESEKQYTNRFKQLKGMYCQDLEYLEVRFAPKDKNKKHKKIVDDIINEYEDFKRNEERPFELVLVGHFIKKSDNRKAENIVTYRDYPLRVDLENRAKIFVDLLKSHPKYTYYIRGIDAASNELHASPEVFAPSFRFITRRISNFPTDYYFSKETYLSLAEKKANDERDESKTSSDDIEKYLSKKPSLGITFHAGEDFVHVISGIRMVYEAVIFLNMPSKSRIGHGTALGIDPEFWIKQIGTKLKIKQGEWLDNLVFLSFFAPPNETKVFEINDDIARYWDAIYGGKLPLPHLNLLRQAYLCRAIDPVTRHALQAKADKLYEIDKLEWDYKSFLGFEPSQKALDLFDMYHSPKYIEEYNKVIEIDITLCWTEIIKNLQNKMITLLNKKHIAIETMPTSNIRISYYNEYYQHHIFNWHSPTDHDSSLKPNLVVASDNPGIFANHMRAEFSHLYQAGIKHEATHQQTMSWLKNLNQNSKVFRF